MQRKGMGLAVCQLTMRKFTLVFSILILVLCECGMARAETMNSALKFYIVSEQKIDGGRFIDTPDFPKVGFIGPKPNLVVTNIENVWHDRTSDYAIMVGTNGAQTIVPSHPWPELTVKLHSGDGKKFASLTEKAIGKRLLIILDEKPLTAARVDERLENGFVIVFKSDADLKKAEDALKKLKR